MDGEPWTLSCGPAWSSCPASPHEIAISFGYMGRNEERQIRTTAWVIRC
jgi:hypothetical protein